MSKDNNSGQSAKNRGAGAASELQIPTLGSMQAAPVLQEGESADVLGAGVGAGYPVKANSQERQEPTSLADVQRQVDAAKSSNAIHRPAFFRPEREQQSEVPPISLEMPLTGSLDAMSRPGTYVEPVTDLGRFEQKVEEMAFLEEMMIIRIHETGDTNSEPVVELGVNGRKVYIKRGEDVIVRRKYVEQLLRAKPESINTRIIRDGNGEPRNLIDKSRALKYPFSIIRDDNPRGRCWERKIRSEA